MVYYDLLGTPSTTYYAVQLYGCTAVDARCRVGAEVTCRLLRAKTVAKGGRRVRGRGLERSHAIAKRQGRSRHMNTAMRA